MIALRGTTVLPEMIVHFDVSREKSIRAVEAAMLHDQKVFLLTQKDPEVETPELDDLDLRSRLWRSLDTVSVVRAVPSLVMEEQYLRAI